MAEPQRYSPAGSGVLEPHTDQRYVAFEVDRHVFAQVCRSQALAMQVLAALARHRPADPHLLRTCGIRWRYGRLDMDGRDEVEPVDDWSA